ncbi:MAG TPA: hypothetical protein VFQ07_00305 [Candidatus Polarisedimenticolia bacterium]|nr:hypothetical protein [Candidatus Polarisedimenticolia bacterium]
MSVLRAEFRDGRLRALLAGAALVLGAVEAWAARFTMNPDGVSYLDMGDAYLRGDLGTAINSWWSPLYSWILGIFLHVLKPTPSREFQVVHLVNLLIYAAALLCFDFFLRALMEDRRNGPEGNRDAEGTPLPAWAWWVLGYGIFTWTSLQLITLRLVSPDLAVSAIVYLAAGILLRQRGRPARWSAFVRLGLVLGTGYLIKTVMLPLAFVFLAVAALSSERPRKAIPAALLAAGIVVAMAAPLIVALSLSKGRVTFGDSARVDYSVYVNGADVFFPESPLLKHPVRTIFDRPRTYEFATPVPGTYPIWYDSSYWHEGLEPRFDLMEQIGAVTRALKLYVLLFVGGLEPLGVSAGTLLLYGLASRPRNGMKRLAACWPILLPALAAFAAYSLIVVDQRFVGAFVCLVWMAAFPGVRVAPSPGAARAAAGVVIGIGAVLAISMTLSAARHVLEDGKEGESSWRAAAALHEKGLRPGDPIAVIGPGAFREGAFVARLARVQVIAEVRSAESLRGIDPPTRALWIEALQRTGVKAILLLGRPEGSQSGMSWEPLGTTDYFLGRVTATP